MINGAQYFRRELMIRLVRAFDAGHLDQEIDQIPIQMRPKNQESSRCCIYHDRAVLKYRLMSLLGITCDEENDEAKSLSAYFTESLSKRLAADAKPLSVCAAACSGCPDARIIVTGNCRGCFARPCLYNCPKQAISIVNQQSTIDPAKCIKCGKCITACAYNAIVKTSVPCEDVCPVGAIHKNEQGVAQIDFEKCIFCGKCFNACPFGAILERSQLLDVLMAMKRGEKVIAMVAPSAASQFPGKIEQLFTAVEKIGFDEVVEVALGAEMTTTHETEEFLERLAEDPKMLMTTSCCPAYVELVKKHLPDFMKNVSTTPSPMIYTMEIVRKKYPDAKVVFVGPCIAKRVEAVQKGVDYVLSFEEVGALLAGRRIDVITSEPKQLERPAEDNARGFMKSSGVMGAVLAEAAKHDPDLKLNTKSIDGLDKKSVAILKLYAAGKLPASFLEVMACNGGCINGPCSLNK